MAEGITNGNGDSITFPGWFLKTVGAVMLLFMGIFLPWATYITVMLLNVSNKVERTTALESRQDILGREQVETRGTAAENRVRITELERRTTALESKTK